MGKREVNSYFDVLSRDAQFGRLYFRNISSVNRLFIFFLAFFPQVTQNKHLKKSKETLETKKVSKVF